MTEFSDKHRYWQRWEITINGRTKGAVKAAMSAATAPSLGFRLLKMKDIFSTSSASTRIEDNKDPIGGMSYGARYKAIVDELAKINIGENGEYGYQRRKLVKELKQKYFPKEGQNESKDKRH